MSYEKKKLFLIKQICNLRETILLRMFLVIEYFLTIAF